LQRPFPEIRIFRPNCALPSNKVTRSPDSAATMAAIIPAAPPPTTMVSTDFNVVHQRQKYLKKQ
jgi:hypothetical protein